MPIFKVMSGRKFYTGLIKPVIDRFTALIMLLILLPLFLIMGLILWVHFGRWPLFSQKRVGKNNTLFLLLKFRSMGIDDDFRSIGRLGRTIRRSSIDEIPQLWNILRGDMSFVGPRPLLPEYLPYFTKEEQRRHDVRPGLTGLAQVNGRSALAWDIRMKMDQEYVLEQSFLLDLKILFQTMFLFLKRPEDREDAGNFIDYAKRR